MPSLTTPAQLRGVLRLPFCYLCGKPFVQGDEKSKDHVPPKACFAMGDRNVPLQLPTHRVCNGIHNLLDEKIGQVVSLKHGRVPPVRNRKLEFQFFPPLGKKDVAGAVTNVDIKGAIRRWIRGFHAALYQQPILEGTNYAIETPFPTARLTPSGPEFDPLRPQHALFVETLKVNRAARNIDCIQSNNQKMTYECVWAQSDTGPWICIFGLDLYAWKDLGDVRNFSGRGCAGSYAMPSGVAPALATRATRLNVLIPNYDPLDPFGR